LAAGIPTIGDRVCRMDPGFPEGDVSNKPTRRKEGDGDGDGDELPWKDGACFAVIFVCGQSWT
jgi:hypothetical protein